MLKELSKYVVIGIAAGIVAYLFTTKESVSITVSNNNQKEVIAAGNSSVSYTHLTLPTKA